MARSKILVGIGGLAYFAIYVSQAVVLTLILVQHHNRNFWWFILAYVPSAAYMAYFFLKTSIAKDDKAVRHVVAIWSMYVFCAFVPIVATIFFTVIENLSRTNNLGPNVLRMTLCFAPGLLILLLNVTISEEHLKFILTLSVTTALDLFDSIEMLEIILLDGHEFHLKDRTKIPIIVFACFGFLVSPVTLLQHRIESATSGDIKDRKKMALIKAFVQRFLVNLPFLVIRIYVWTEHGYESTVFIAKNIIALIVGILEIVIAIKCCECGPTD